MNILFICKHNRFRSKVAETFFKKLNKNKKIKVNSGGISLDILRPYIEKNVIKMMKEKDCDIKGKPKRITNKSIREANLIIIVADNVNKEYFSNSNARIIKWKIMDCDASDIKNIKRAINQIEHKVKRLIGEHKITKN